MPTYRENKCIAEFSLPAWAKLSTVCSMNPEEYLQRIAPPSWHVMKSERDLSGGTIRVIFDHTEGLWEQEEFEPLPCIGRFSTGGDEALVVTHAARDLHDALQAVFAGKESEGR